MSLFPPKWHDAEYAAKRMAEIKQQQYPDSSKTIQMISDFEWLIDEAEYLRRALRERTGGAW